MIPVMRHYLQTFDESLDASDATNNLSTTVELKHSADS